MTLTDIKNYYINEIIQDGYASNKKQAEKVFLESLTRNLVKNEIMEMCAFISQDDDDE